MRKVKGGYGSCICSTGGPNTPGYPSSGTCGGSMDSGDANSLASDLNGSGDGYTYTVVSC